MFYGIQYAYGRDALNQNGTRADLIYAFTSRRLRDKWTKGGEQFGGPGSRDPLRASSVLVRRARRYAMIENGDTEAWYELARDRINEKSRLGKWEHLLLADWEEAEEHYQWVATASITEIVDWCKVISK